MREMKDSGIEWIGKIPKDWKTTKLKYTYNNSNVGEAIDKDNYGEGSIIFYTAGMSYTFMSYDGFPKWKYTQSNDILLARNGTPYVYLPQNGAAYSDHIIRIDIKKEYDKRFLRYSLQRAIEAVAVETVSISTWSVSLWKEQILPLPNYESQRKLADYLDEKCAKIDAIIEKQQEIIEKLKEYKLSIISEAVTKGLDPDVKMKDSGAEFIGEIPYNWSVAKLGNIFDFIGGYAFNSDMYVSESNNQVVRIGNVKNGYMPLDSNPVYVSDETAEKANRFLIKPNYILFTMTGTKGKRDYFFTHVVSNKDCEEKRLYINQRVGCFVAKEGTCPDYYGYLLKDNRILDGIFLYETGTANQGNLGIDSISRTKVHVPPYDEQVKISEYLGERCGAVDKSIEGRTAVVEKLTAYKKSLIYEVVTGKREV